MSTVRVVRPPVWQRIVCAGPLAGPAAVLAVGGGQEDGWLRLLSLAGVPVLPLIAHRGWQLRVELGDGVSIVHWLGTVHVPWADVERFGYDDTSGVWVRRRDGREHAVAAFPFVPGALAGATRRGRAAAELLEGVRTRRRAKGGGRDR